MFLQFIIVIYRIVFTLMDFFQPIDLANAILRFGE